MFQPRHREALDTEQARAFFKAAQDAAYRFWFRENKTLEDCPDCGGMDGIVGDDGEQLQHYDDCLYGRLIERYWSMVEAGPVPEGPGE